MTWKGRKKYKKCIIKKKKTYIILRQGIMPLHMLFLFFSFKKKKIKKFSKSEKFWFCIHANINHASAHCSPKNEGMRAHIVVKNNDFKDFFFFFYSCLQTYVQYTTSHKSLLLSLCVLLCFHALCRSPILSLFEFPDGQGVWTLISVGQHSVCAFSPHLWVIHSTVISGVHWG